MSGQAEMDPSKQPDYGEVIDKNTFEQILEMDDEDDDDREFSSSIVTGFFEQAVATFDDMEAALTAKDLKKLSNLGHFLKGSSATLGLTRVQKGCEKIQHYGANQNDEGNPSKEPDDEQLDKIAKVLLQVRRDYAEAARRLKQFYGI